MQDVYLCVHGHFYQPPRLNPFTGLIDREPAAAPYHDFNEKIWDECYRPNAELGNFGHMSFDLGPTLASWLQGAHPATLQLITSAARVAYERTGHGNALAQAYHHTILPLATSREKRLQIAWGVRDFRRRYGYPPEGLWLPETAADEETLQLLAEQGLALTVLAPWQAAVEIDTREPHRLDLGGGRSLCLFFYNSALSGDVSFNGDTTADATRFATHDLAAQVRREAEGERRKRQLLLIATDGEVYGHHKRFRDLFLAHLLGVDAPAAGYTLTSLAGYLALCEAEGARWRAGALPPSALRLPTSWSCAHGVARWDEGCACTPGDSSWKRPLRRALRRLATSLDAIFEAESAGALRHPWHALESYLDLRDGAVAPATYWATHAQRPLRTADELRLGGLLEMQFMRQAMFVSCAWFFEDLDRLEPRIALAHAHRAITLAARHSGADLAPGFVADLAASHSACTGRSAADLYDELAQAVTDVA